MAVATAIASKAPSDTSATDPRVSVRSRPCMRPAAAAVVVMAGRVLVGLG